MRSLRVGFAMKAALAGAVFRRSKATVALVGTALRRPKATVALVGAAFRRPQAPAVLLLVSALASQYCSSTPASAPPAESTTGTPDAAALTPVLSVKELMEHIIDPTADWIFDAAVVDVSEKGVVETKPLTDEDWLKVERGTLLLAESANLLKMPRAIEPPGSKVEEHKPGEPAPELSAAEIDAKINQDRALWNKHADDLRVVALDSLKVVRARSAQALFDVGGAIDKACEGCHLEYWYPGDKKYVLEDLKKKVTYDPPKK